MVRPSIGARELALLRHVAATREASVGEVVAGFGAAHGLARSTVLTMMERLRAKGYLERHRVNGVFHYRSATPPGEATRNAIAGFVERTLGGSVSPLVAWMAERGKVSDDELAELQALVARLRAGRKEK